MTYIQKEEMNPKNEQREMPIPSRMPPPPPPQPNNK